jgi:hypothetical protein
MPRQNTDLTQFRRYRHKTRHTGVDFAMDIDNIQAECSIGV